MPWLVLVCMLALTTQGFAASGASDRERKLDEQYRRCVQACKKPTIRQETNGREWIKNIQAESRYDNCVHNCDRMSFRGFKK